MTFGRDSLLQSHVAIFTLRGGQRVLHVSTTSVGWLHGLPQAVSARVHGHKADILLEALPLLFDRSTTYLTNG